MKYIYKTVILSLVLSFILVSCGTTSAVASDTSSEPETAQPEASTTSVTSNPTDSVPLSSAPVAENETISINGKEQSASNTTLVDTPAQEENQATEANDTIDDTTEVQVSSNNETNTIALQDTQDSTQNITSTPSNSSTKSKVLPAQALDIADIMKQFDNNDSTNDIAEPNEVSSTSDNNISTENDSNTQEEKILEEEVVLAISDETEVPLEKVPIEEALLLEGIEPAIEKVENNEKEIEIEPVNKEITSIEVLPIKDTDSSNESTSQSETDTQDMQNIAQDTLQNPKAEVVTSPILNDIIQDDTEVAITQDLPQNSQEALQDTIVDTSTTLLENTTETTQTPSLIQNIIPTNDADDTVVLAQDENEEYTEESSKVSRKVTMPQGQYLDIEYPGNGWVYLGETQKKDIAGYFGKKIDDGRSTFILRSKKPGTVILHFYKNDILTGNYIDDYMELTVTADKGSLQEHTKAPDYASIVPPKPDFNRNINIAKDKDASSTATKKTLPKETLAPSDKSTKTAQEKPNSPPVNIAPAPVQKTTSVPNTIVQNETANSSSLSPKVSTSSTVQNQSKEPEALIDIPQDEPLSLASNQIFSTDITPPVTTPKQEEIVTNDEPILPQWTAHVPTGPGEDIFLKAQKAFDNKQYKDALNLVKDFLQVAGGNADKGLYLQGQILEADSDIKNIRSAIDSYQALTKGHLSSPLWKKANERAMYLKRFYFNQR